MGETKSSVASDNPHTAIEAAQGVDNDDVDWFLRDSQIPVPVTSLTLETTSTPNDSGPNKSAGAAQDATGTSLHTTLSNTNETVASKTKPSIATIQEEPVMSPPRSNSITSSRGRSNSLGIRRTNSVTSTGSHGSANKESGGFFSRIKEKFHRSPPSSPKITPSTVFKENYNMSSKSSPAVPLSKTATHPESELSRTSSHPFTPADHDPKLDEYINFFSNPDHRPGSRKNSVSDGCLTNPITAGEENGGNRFTAFLKRKSTSSSPLPLVTIATEYNRRSSESTPSLNLPSSPKLPAQGEDVLPEFSALKPLKRVAFHSSTFLLDPPQQIPAKSPRQGNVEVLSTGQLKIHPLSGEDKKAIERSLKGQGGGVVVGGTGSLHFLPKKKDDGTDDDEDAEEKEAKDFEQQSSFSLHGKNISIDKPIIPSKQRVNYTAPVEKMALDVMYTRCCHLREILPIPAILKQIPKNLLAPLTQLQLRNPTPTMIEVETFADFIRIAPIICISLDGVNLTVKQFRILLSAMSAKKQLEKLSLRNMPMDSDGWCLLCWFLSRNTVLQRLDITQCPSLTVNTSKKKKKKDPEKSRKRDENLVRMVCNVDNRSDMDWSLFTATLVARGGIEELILTGCCITDISLFEKLFKFALSIKTNRLGMAYNKLNLKEQRIILHSWFFKPFVRGLDLGYNDFSTSQLLNSALEIINDPVKVRLLEKSQLAFLSLNSTNMRFNPKFRKVFDDFLIKLPNLKYLDLSNNPKLFGASTEPVEGDSSSVTKQSTNSSTGSNSTTGSSATNGSLESSTLATQDEVVSYFISRFPLFPQLKRLHLENSNLSTNAIISIANILPFCKNIGYLSLLGNTIEPKAAAALLQAVKNTPTMVTLEGDFDELPGWFKDRLGIYTMRNMENTLYPPIQTKGNESSLTAQLNDILEIKSKNQLDLDSKMVKDFMKEAKEIKTQLHEAVNELNKLQLEKQLTLEGKETLIRLMFIDSSISKGLQLIDPSLTIGVSYPEIRITEFPTAEEEDAGDGNLAYAYDLNRGDEVGYKTPPKLSRNGSRTSLNQLDKEEGSMHRIHSSLDVRDDTHSQFMGLDQLSGEEIRKKISNVDLNQLLDISKFIANLRKNGVPLSTIFENFRRDHQVSLDISSIKEKLKSLQVHNHEAAPSDDAHSSDEKLKATGISSNPSMMLDDHNGDHVNEIYDDVLDTLLPEPKEPSK